MKPVMIHAGGTDCRHEGTPRATIHDEGGPLCAAGIRVTHVRFNGKVLTIGEACAALKNAADVFATQLTPVITALAELGNRIGAALGPAIRALTAAAEVVDEERELDEDLEESWSDQFTMAYDDLAVVVAGVQQLTPPGQVDG
jgi:hypothetical protein